MARLSVFIPNCACCGKRCRARRITDDSIEKIEGAGRAHAVYRRQKVQCTEDAIEPSRVRPIAFAPRGRGRSARGDPQGTRTARCAVAAPVGEQAGQTRGRNGPSLASRNAKRRDRKPRRSANLSAWQARTLKGTDVAKYRKTAENPQAEKSRSINEHRHPWAVAFSPTRMRQPDCNEIRSVKDEPFGKAFRSLRHSREGHYAER